MGSAAEPGGGNFQRSTRDRDYWLGQCEGFRVVGPQGRVGTVESLEYARRGDRPDALVVRHGLLRRARVRVPVERIADIRPREQLIVLRD